MRLIKLTVWTFGGLTVVSLFIGEVGGHVLLNHVQRTYIDMQSAANAQQARRLAGVLEQELAAGTTPTEVRNRLQSSLRHSPYDDTGFLCLLDSNGKVLCHPDPKEVGMPMNDALVAGLHGGSATTLGEWLATGGHGARLMLNQSYGGKTHIVYTEPVTGTDWSVAVHANAAQIARRVDLLRNAILVIAMPIFAAFIVLGTIATRFIGRRYERRIESANAALEERVAERTAALATASARYRTLFETAPGAIFVCRPNGTILDANRRAVDLTGRPRSTLLDLSFDELCTVSSAFPASPAESGTPEDLGWDGTLTTAEGAIRHVHVYRSTVASGDGTLVQEFVQDVTERRQLEAQFLRAQKMEAVGQLAGGVAHDFNNLLTAIIGFSQLTVDARPNDPIVQRYVGEVIKSGQMASSLTRQLLAFSRKQVLAPQPVNLNDLLHNMENMLRRVIGETVTVATEYADGLGTVNVDPGQMEQVVLNLAVNARDAMPGGGILTIATANIVRCVTDDDDGEPRDCADRIQLSVRDTGTGIPAEIRDRIFEPFFTTKEDGKGTGLGLSTLHGIVKQHGGDIRVESELGKGTSFVITLPRIEQTGAAANEAPAPLTHGRETVLIVEDQPPLLEFVRLVLCDIGYRVLTASCGEEALAKARSFTGKLDMMLTDLVMPGMSVRDLVRQLHVTRPETAIAYMTGYTNDVIVKEGVLIEGATLLHKPFTAQDLAAMVRNVLDESASRPAAASRNPV